MIKWNCIFSGRCVGIKLRHMLENDGNNTVTQPDNVVSSLYTHRQAHVLMQLKMFVHLAIYLIQYLLALCRNIYQTHSNSKETFVCPTFEYSSFVFYQMAKKKKSLVCCSFKNLRMKLDLFMNQWQKKSKIKVRSALNRSMTSDI